LPPVIFPDGGAGVEATGLPLGLFAGGEYSVRKLTLAPDQGLLLYTDGLTEARNTLDEEFGVERLSSFLHRHSHLPGPDLMRSCRQQWSDFMGGAPRVDDMTILLVRRRLKFQN
jgi:sigma-B regulation protein RsbU (phosphoserine phosphatase)